MSPDIFYSIVFHFLFSFYLGHYKILTSIAPCGLKLTIPAFDTLQFTPLSLGIWVIFISFLSSFHPFLLLSPFYKILFIYF